MAVLAKTFETYNNSLIFEDLQNAYSMLSPTECPFQQAVGDSGTTSATNVEWPVVELNAVDPTNRVVEGEDAPATDDATNGVRLGNFTQISDKKVITSQTSEKVDAAGDNLQKIAKQVTFKLKELKRDKEVMLLQNIAASAGASGTARQAAGFPAFIRTNVSMGALGTNPTLSGISEGYPDVAAVSGTARAFTEDMFNGAIQLAWENGGDPTLVLVNANNKRIISETFVGNATRYKDTMDKKVMNAIDFYESDFGTLTIVPTRFMLPADGVGGTRYMVLGIDPEFVEIKYLDPVQEKPLADTGHNHKRLIWCEYTLQVDAEAAHFIIRDTNGVMP
jgi:hypothetical protein